MRHHVPAVVATLALLLGLAALSQADSHESPPGRKVFLASECNECHTIQTQGIEKLPPKEDEEDDLELGEEEDLFAFDGEDGGEEEQTEPPDLSAVGKRHEADWIRQFVTKQIENDKGKRHRKLFKGSDTELGALVDYLAGLKTPAPQAQE